jgi:hypothetical protein
MKSTLYSSLPGFLQRLVKRVQGRPDTEFQQALIRLRHRRDFYLYFSVRAGSSTPSTSIPASTSSACSFWSTGKLLIGSVGHPARLPFTTHRSACRRGFLDRRPSCC